MAINIGDTIGKVKVIELTRDNKNSDQKLYKCQCQCGNFREYTAGYLRNHSWHEPSCRQCIVYPTGWKKLTVKIGQKFNKLTVIDDVGRKDKRGNYFYKCQCECGNIKWALGYKLYQNITKSCNKDKCRYFRRSKYCGELSGKFWSQIVGCANKRNHQITITQQEAWDLFLAQQHKCALTGLELTMAKYTNLKGTASLDRIDSTKGYIPGNVQWIHKDLQRMKWNYPQEYFIKICKLVTQKHVD